MHPAARPDPATWAPLTRTPSDLGVPPTVAALTGLLQRDGAAVRRGVKADGAWLLRGFPVGHDAAFAAVAAAALPTSARYVFGQSDRQPVAGAAYTSTAYPARERIPLHGELSYVRAPPALLAFGCVVAADTGGATPLVCGAALLDALDPALVDRWTAAGLRYRKVMHGGTGPGPHLGKSWQRHFEENDASAVERILADEGATWRWGAHDQLRVTLTRPAVRPHPTLGRPVWAAQATLWHARNLGRRRAVLERLLGTEGLPTSVTFGDGSPISEADLDAVDAAAERLAWRAPWQAGDVVLVDNLRVLHGREPFTGDRRVLVALGDGPA